MARGALTLWVVFLWSSASLAAAPPAVKVTRAVVTTLLDSKNEPRAPAQVIGTSARAYFHVEASGFVPKRTYKVHITVSDAAGKRVGDYGFRRTAWHEKEAIWHAFTPLATQAPGMWTLRLDLDDQLVATTQVQVDPAANRVAGNELERWWPALVAGLLLTLGYIGWGVATAPRALPDAALAPQPGAAAIDQALAALIVANLFPFGLVLFAHANAADLLLVYWCENLVVGVYAILRMLTVPHAFPAVCLFIPFFVFHFGLFTFVHYALLVGIFGDQMNLVVLSPQGFHPSSPVQFFRDPLDLFEELPTLLALQIALLVMSHGISFAHNFMKRGEYLSSNVILEMLRPYPRLIAMHVAIIAVAFVALKMSSPLGVLIVLIALKTGFDIYGLRRRRAGALALLGRAR